jgi:hypothetical protein
MRSMILTLTLTLLGSTAALAQNGKADAAAARAQELVKQARAAIGGEEKLKALQSLSAAGTFRRLLGDREMSGEVEFDLLLPDKFMKTETLVPMPGAEVTMVQAVNGDKVWSDSRSSGPARIMIRPGGDGPHAQAAFEQTMRAEFARLLLGWLLTSPSSFSVEFSYAGQAKAEDGTADVVEVKGPHGFAARLFLDQKTHLPLMLSYRGVAPRIITHQRTAGAGQGQQEIEKAAKEAQAKAEAEVAASRPPEVEVQVRFSDYRIVGGLLLPHRLTKATDGQANEEWEMTKFKLNPTLKPEKFEKK